MQLKEFKDIQREPVVLMYTSNPKYGYLEGEPMIISFRKEVIEAILRGLSNFHTSYVKSMQITDGILKVETRNSIYEFAFRNKEFWDNSELIFQNRKELEKEIVKIEQLSKGDFYV